MQEKKEYELSLAGDNKEAKEKIDKEYSTKQKALQKEQAQRDKELAVIGIILNTARGITAALASSNVPLSIAIGILGAIQLATAKGVKLPAFEKGTDHAPGGLAIVGEKGSELLIAPSGSVSLTPSEPSLMNLQAGTQVIPHEETMRMMAIAPMRDKIDVQPHNQYDFRNLEKRLDSLEKTIKNKKETHINVTRQGLETMMKNAETRQYFLNNIYN